jgi:hypothetical protein
MKRHAYQTFPGLAIGVALSLLVAPAESSASPTLVPAGAPKSVFVDDVEFGRDPFFPASVRRPKILIKTSDNEPPRPMVPDFVVLKGISTFQGRKLAIINNYTVGEGEEFWLKTGGQPLRIKCVEIKDKSAVVSVSGATKEIPLRAGF